MILLAYLKHAQNLRWLPSVLCVFPYPEVWGAERQSRPLLTFHHSSEGHRELLEELGLREFEGGAEASGKEPYAKLPRVKGSPYAHQFILEMLHVGWRTP